MRDKFEQFRGEYELCIPLIRPFHQDHLRDRALRGVLSLNRRVLTSNIGILALNIGVCPKKRVLSSNRGVLSSKRSNLTLNIGVLALIRGVWVLEARL
jgi:hypothetical protein